MYIKRSYAVGAKMDIQSGAASGSNTPSWNSATYQVWV